MNWVLGSSGSGERRQEGHRGPIDKAPWPVSLSFLLSFLGCRRKGGAGETLLWHKDWEADRTRS